MTISTQIITVLDDLCRRFGLAIDWSQENVMPYLQELAGKYISWEIACSWALIALAGVIVAIGIAMIVLDVKVFKEGVCGMFGFCVIAGGLILAGVEIFDILTCVHFPEKQIAEYITDLMRSKT